MDKYEFNIKVEQMKKLVEERDYPTAMKIADSIDWGRVRNTNLLSMAAAVYEENGEIQEAKDKLLLAFERAPIGKRLLYKLTELSVKSGDLEEAEDYYHEFQDLAPDDVRSCLLAYMILKARGASPEELAEPLERYIAVEPDERWLYELAEVYAAAGRTAECISACDRVALLFGAGPYSEKAMRLKQRYAGLSSYQQNIVADSVARESAARLERAGAARPNAAVRTAARVSQPQELYGTEAAPDTGDRAENNATSDESQGIHLPDLQTAQRQSAQNTAELPPLEEDRAGDILANQRYENEDAAFEAYVRLHRLDEPVRKETRSEEKAYGAVMPEKSLNPEDNELNDGFSDQLSQEVSRLSAEETEKPAADGAAAGELSGQTRILDEVHVRRLRKVVILDDHLAGEPRIVARDAETAKAGALKQAAALAERLNAASGQTETAALQQKQKAAEAAAALDTEKEKETQLERPAVPERKAKEATASGSKAVQGDKAQKEAVKTAASESGAETTPGAEKPQGERKPVESKLEEAKPQKTYHMVIEAATPEDGLAIAIDELKYIHREQGVKHAAAKTTAEKLNQKGLGQTALEKIRGKDFIVEHAGALQRDVAEQIEGLMRTDRSGMIVVLIDVPEGLDRLEDTCPALFEHCDLVSDFEEEGETEEASSEDETEDTSYADEAYDDKTPENRDEDASAVEETPEATEASEEEPEENRNAVYDASYELEDEPGAEEAEAEQPAKRKKHGSGKKAVPEKKQSNVKAYIPADENEEMEIDDFAQYCCQFASEIDCSITGKSMLALYERIELMEEDNIPLTRKTAEDLIEEAADRAEKPPIGKRLKGLFSSRYDKNGLLILKEEDFIY